MRELISIPPGGDVIFDGDCGVCTWIVKVLMRFDRSKRLKFLASNHPQTFERYPTLSIERARHEILAHDPRSGWYGGWQACEWIMLRIPALWIFVPFTLIPGSDWLGDLAYKFFAKHRAKISSLLGLNACRLSDNIPRT